MTDTYAIERKKKPDFQLCFYSREEESVETKPGKFQEIEILTGPGESDFIYFYS